MTQASWRWAVRSRLERLEEKRDDLAEYLMKWSFGMRLSERRAYERKIAKLDHKIWKLRGDDV